MFADIAGFTAWSSTREPCQVFQLLETLYCAFDEIAKARRVFKVETVGDCYVAVVGLPSPRKDHAVAMGRFASNCLRKAREIFRRLEIELGPDTAELSFRVGIHSGPVTAGILRGENARFQLFGDTMNTASRMEGTSIRDHIQVSQQTADLLIKSGKSHWITPREDLIEAKGKGTMQTFWLQLDRSADRSSANSSSYCTSSTSGSEVDLEMIMDCNANSQQEVEYQKLSSKHKRLVEWNTAVLLERIKAVIQKRETGKMDDPSAVEIDREVESQLQTYVYGIATLYRENSFHNLEHASHVTMSVVKLLARVASTNNGTTQEANKYTEDISSDAVMQLAAVFSALIHDVDHTGVPNAQLVAEEAPVAKMYNNKSVAEKNSIVIAWDFFLQPQFDDLRVCICPTKDDLDLFHQLVVKVVLATDICDKELKQDRDARWEKVFGDSHSVSTDEHLNQLKAGIVLEHLIQASDIAHTMQHWHIYRKWNERFFVECYNAYQAGRADKDPAESWYKGELGFFDFYIIPLAKKLKDCDVFGVSSDEYLNYALHNRAEWESKGQKIVEEMMEKSVLSMVTAVVDKTTQKPHGPSIAQVKSVEGPNEAQATFVAPTKSVEGPNGTSETNLVFVLAPVVSVPMTEKKLILI
jgi:class 3 adenylate cyclase